MTSFNKQNPYPQPAPSQPMQDTAGAAPGVVSEDAANLIADKMRELDLNIDKELMRVKAANEDIARAHVRIEDLLQTRNALAQDLARAAGTDFEYRPSPAPMTLSALKPPGFAHDRYARENPLAVQRYMLADASAAVPGKTRRQDFDDQF